MLKKVLVLAAVLTSATTFAQALSPPTRTTTYDWQCQDANGNRISDHQRIELAYVSCINSPLGAFIQGGRYRITKPSSTLPPSPPPTPTTGTLELTWAAPTLREDGSALQPGVLTGYRIYYGTSPTELTNIATALPNETRKTFTIPKVLHYFRMVALVGNEESTRTNEVTGTPQ